MNNQERIVSYEDIVKRIKKACLRVSRDPKEVVLLAVSKKQPLDKIESIFHKGQLDFGENYVQEFLDKKTLLQHLDINWHLIGPLQANKVNKVVGKVSLIHSVSDLKIAQKISEAALAQNKFQRILVQVNAASEETKSGIELSEVGDFLKKCESLKGIIVQGFMSMPPLTPNAEDSRVYFKELYRLRMQFAEKYPMLKELSMGTTQDFEVAIEEGATIVRIGEALFGRRMYP